MTAASGFHPDREAERVLGPCLDLEQAERLATYGERADKTYRVAALIGRYRVESEPDERGRWRIWDAERDALVATAYPDQEAAEAGARMHAAYDILTYLDEREGR